MWNRKAVKLAAKGRIKENYWRMVLIGLLMAFLTGGATISFNFASPSSFRDMQEAISEGSEEEIADAIDEMSAIDRDELEEVIDSAIEGLADDDDFMEALGIIVMVFIVIVVVAIIVGILLSVFLINPVAQSCRRFFVVNIKNKAELSEIHYGFSRSYMNQVKIMFLRDLYTFLWGLLLWIPGIIKSYEYRMVPFLLTENPDLETKEAFALSKEMMDGNKWKAFVFDLSFIGWWLLSGITCGIVGVLYVNPYYYQATAMLYDAIKYDKNINVAPVETVVDIEAF